MHAYYEIETEIPASHQLSIQLPDNIPEGKAKLAIIYELTEARTNIRMANFLADLPDCHAKGLTREEIQSYMDQERQSWRD